MRRAGRHLGGRRPYGYSIAGDRLIADPIEQTAIALMPELRDAGRTLRQISAAVAAAGFPPLSFTAVRSVLRRGPEWPGAILAEAAD